ncbi:YaaR family protein [Exiguobacterium sp. s6]|uniref:YaaR family protein n=1 Tax=Exiguobacterium sp. s6 TaxID=2751236 RepID=UPI001BEC073D|nr:YaaR family protein [Exiguobacterium sp. s6]
MDIRRIMETQSLHGAGKAKRPDAEPSVSFSNVIGQKREDREYERFQRQIAAIHEQGELLAESQTVESLTEYKRLIKDFMKDAVDAALSLEDKRGFNRRGRAKIYKIVEQVDQKLLALTDQVISGEASRLSLLDQVGEIRGLLVNVYV